MLINYFKTAWRYMARNKVSSVINVLGLSLGIVSCLMIFLVTRHELSFDTFHPGKERIYRLLSEKELMGKTMLGSGMLNPMITSVRDEITGLEAATEFYIFPFKVTIPRDGEDKQFEAPRMGIDALDEIITDPSYFDIFQYDWLAGSPSVMADPYKVVLAESKARKYFGDMPYDDMLGQEVIYGKDLHVTVAGIVKDWTQNTDFIFTDFISAATIPSSSLSNVIEMDAWGLWTSSAQVYVKLTQGVSLQAVEDQFPVWVDKYVRKSPDMKIKMVLQPLNDIHFNTKLSDVYIRSVHLPTLYGLMAIAVFILLIAAFNFINLSTAQSMQRSKEIGVRKVLGGRRSNLIAQFMGETLLTTLFAVMLALLVAWPLLRMLHSFIPQGVSIGWDQPFTWLFLLVVVVCTTFLAGWYPARVLSAYSPVESTKGAVTHRGSSGNVLRKTLIIFQFTISLFFIIGALVVGDQIHYMMNKDLGFDKDAIVTIRLRGNNEVLAEKIKQYPYVKAVSIHTETPTAIGHSGTRIKYMVNGELHEIQSSMEFCDENFMSLYDFKLVAGRQLHPSAYMMEFVINETCARELGFAHPQDAIGHMIKSGQWDRMPEGEEVPFDQRQAPIVGVVADFHLQALDKPITPICISTTKQAGRVMSVKLATTGKNMQDTKQIISDLEKAWKEVYPDERFNYSFYDDTLASFYEKERKMSKVVTASMLMAIFISCMGLFGLAVFTTKQRTKEIGIRKVLGASMVNVLALLSGGFLKLVVIALFIATPVAWYAANRWLEGFAYHVPVRWWIFVLAGILALLITLLTISLQTFRVARANPVNALKTD